MTIGIVHGAWIELSNRDRFLWRVDFPFCGVNFV